jgi:ribosomal protein S18 acetylase RimI-like enzyme
MFREYEAELEIDLCFQGFEEELISLPGKYAPPNGALLLAFRDGQAAGCGALRFLEPGTGELKRIYVRPQFRGRGLGRIISEELVRRAAAAGYERLRLDTLTKLTPAIHMYKALGFHEIAPYSANPGLPIVYMELEIGSKSLKLA